MSAFIAGFVVGAVAMLLGFVWANRKKPEELDKAEDFIRK